MVLSYDIKDCVIQWLNDVADSGVGFLALWGKHCSLLQKVQVNWGKTSKVEQDFMIHRKDDKSYLLGTLRIYLHSRQKLYLFICKQHQNKKLKIGF